MIGPRCQPVPAPPAPAGWTRQELAELDDRELLGIAGSLPRFGQRRMAACELLVVRYRYLVRSCVQRYNRGPKPAEDLLQVGYVGLVAAINNFDPAVGCSLATYARSHINGEIKRYFRDKRWQIHVVRPVKELVMQSRRATWELAQELGHMPTESDLAAALGVSGHDLRNAQLAEMAFELSSLDAPLSGQPGTVLLADLLGGDGPGCTWPGPRCRQRGVRYAVQHVLRRCHQGTPVVCRSVSELVSTDVAPSTTRPLNSWRP